MTPETKENYYPRLRAFLHEKHCILDVYSVCCHELIAKDLLLPDGYISCFKASFFQDKFSGKVFVDVGFVVEVHVGIRKVLLQVPPNRSYCVIVNHVDQTVIARDIGDNAVVSFNAAALNWIGSGWELKEDMPPHEANQR